MSSVNITDRETCEKADAEDELRHFREEFVIPSGVIYLDGNSLGARPSATSANFSKVIEQEWGIGLIRSWNDAHWFDLPVNLGDKLGRLIGSENGETVISDTTSVNLFKVLMASINIQKIDHPDRRIIVVERDNFPTDLYIVEGIVKFLDQGYELRYADDTNFKETIRADTVLVILSHVNYRTGNMFDMKDISEHARSQGVHTIWDLAHSIGAVPVDLNASGADFAVGCTYKYLNGGPGSPAFLWVKKIHQTRAWQPLSGWWGHEKPFDMSEYYKPYNGIRRYLCGTQCIPAYYLIECGIDIALKADIALLRRKSLKLSDLLIHLVENRLSKYGLKLVTSRDHNKRGSHISFQHPKSYQLIAALIKQGIIGEWVIENIFIFFKPYFYLKLLYRRLS